MYTVNVYYIFQIQRQKYMVVNVSDNLEMVKTN